MLAIENKRGEKKERHEYVRANHPRSLFMFHFRFKRRIKPPNKFHKMQQIRGRIFQEGENDENASKEKLLALLEEESKEKPPALLEEEPA